MGVWTTATKTWAAAEKVTAALLNAQLRDFANAFGAWTDYTPTVTQSGTVTYTKNYAKYVQVQKTVIFAVELAITGTGTGNNAIHVTVPITAARGSSIVCGSGLIYDQSAAAHYGGALQFASTTTVGLVGNSAANFAGITPNFGLASPDGIRLFGVYEAA